MITVEITHLIIIGILTFLLGFVLGRYIVPTLQRYHDNWVEKQKEIQAKHKPWLNGSLESRFVAVVEERLNALYLKTNCVTSQQLQDFSIWLKTYAETQSYHNVVVDWLGSTESYTVIFRSAERVYEIKGKWKSSIDTPRVELSLA